MDYFVFLDQHENCNICLINYIWTALLHLKILLVGVFDGRNTLSICFVSLEHTFKCKKMPVNTPNGAKYHILGRKIHV